MRRVTVTAVNIEASTPTVRVTANPRTGPEPSQNSTNTAISVVTLESMIVMSARE
jgi:hypothetical protein